MGLVQLLRRLDASVTPNWFANWTYTKTCIPVGEQAQPKPLKTPSGTEVILEFFCPGEQHDNLLNNITDLHLEAVKLPSELSDALHVLPALDQELVAALRSIPALQKLVLYVGAGTLVPQLAAMTSLVELQLYHYCLRGPIPASMLTSMPNLLTLTVTSVVAGAGDPAGGMCGISGTDPDIAAPHLHKSSNLNLPYNQLTGQLPSSLLFLASRVHLQHNKFTGSIPGCQATTTHAIKAAVVDVSGNHLEASCAPTLWFCQETPLPVLHVDTKTSSLSIC